MEETLILIKPDAVQAGHSGKIIDRIIQEGFEIKGVKLLKLSSREAEKFYKVHKDRPFFKEMTQYMSSGPIIAACLSRENAVLHWRSVIGATNPSEAEKDTIRAEFGTSVEENAVHGSDSVPNAHQEVSFFFSSLELV